MSAITALEDTPLTLIETEASLKDLVNILKNEAIIGLDTEYSDHGYTGLTCLVQISTASEDYIVDAIALKHHMKHLSVIFENAGIMKILHAAQNDLKWLYEDFGLMLRNIFDTQIAMKVLKYEKMGLAPVIEEKFGLKLSKNMQRADFRKRPLPEGYKQYARADTHFLIPLYRELESELCQKKLSQVMLKRCSEFERTKIEKTREDAAFIDTLENVKSQYERRLLVLKKLSNWRHEVAKREDKNVGYIMSKRALNDLVMCLPKDPETILKMCDHSKFVKADFNRILSIMGVKQQEPNRKPSELKPKN